MHTSAWGVDVVRGSCTTLDNGERMSVQMERTGVERVYDQHHAKYKNKVLTGHGLQSSIELVRNFSRSKIDKRTISRAVDYQFNNFIVIQYKCVLGRRELGLSGETVGYDIEQGGKVG